MRKEQHTKDPTIYQLKFNLNKQRDSMVLINPSQYYRQIREVEIVYEESHDEGGAKFQNFDYITKRYLEYC